MRAAHHHAVQRGGVLRDVDADGSNFDYSSIVCFQPSLGTIQGLGFGNTAFHNSSNREGNRIYLHVRQSSYSVMLKCWRGFKC